MFEGGEGGRLPSILSMQPPDSLRSLDLKNIARDFMHASTMGVKEYALS